MTKNNDFLKAGEELNQLVSDYIENKITMAEIAKKIGKTRSLVSFAFNKNIFPNPTSLRERFKEKAYLTIAEEIEKGTPVEEIVDQFSFLKDKKKIQRLIREGKIKTKKPVLTKRDIERNSLKEEIITAFENGASLPEIISQFKIPRGLVTSILLKEYGEASVLKAREIVIERKKQKR